MILFAVFQQYIKVLFSKHGLELCDVGGQWSGSGLCFRTASGSFHEALRCCGHGSEVDLVGHWEETYEE